MRTLAATLTLAEQAERHRIAQTLHDDLQQRLYAIQINLAPLLQAWSTEDAELQAQVEETQHWLNEGIQLTRQLTVELSPPILKEEGFIDALAWLALQMAETYQLHIELVAAHAFPLANEALRVLLFQIVRELLFNVVKHAGVQQATVEVRDGVEGELVITVRDGGRGFDVAAAAAAHAGGFGLFSVRERLNLVGGHMMIDAAPAQGTRITLTIPVVSPQGATAPLAAG